MCCVRRLRFPHPRAEAQPNILHVQSVGINFDAEEAGSTFAIRPVDEEGCCTVFRRASAGRLKVNGMSFIALLHHDWRKFCEKYCYIITTINFIRRRL